MYQPAAPAYAHYRQGSFSSGPPHKKTRGNPIITRYPPPPGYRPPPQSSWQQPQLYNGTFAPPAYTTFQQFPPPSPSYAPYKSQQFPSAYPSPQVGYFPGAQFGWQSALAPQSAQATAWQPPLSGFEQSLPRRHSSAPLAPSQNSHLDGNGDPMPPIDFPLGSTADLEEAFDGECYYARHPEDINPDLTLGLIEWKAPVPTSRALAAAFQEDDHDFALPGATGTHEESISRYFKGPKREEAFLSVRQTEEWNHVKDDLIYREFSVICSRIIAMSELLSNYRVQFDAEWARDEECSPSPEVSPTSTPGIGERNGVHRHAGSRASSVAGYSVDQPGDESSLLDDLQHAMAFAGRRSSTESRSGSVTSHHAAKITRPKALPPVRDSRQEDILAALGVTGSPKMVYQTPGPAFGPPPSTSSSQGQHSRSNSMHSARGSLSNSNLVRQSSCSSSHHSYGDQNRRPTSSHSYLSAEASDFDPEPDNDVTPRPNKSKEFSNDSRKRSHADSMACAPAQLIHEEDEETPKQKRRQPRVDSTR